MFVGESLWDVVSARSLSGATVDIEIFLVWLMINLLVTPSLMAIN
jgi:hypothetical protein